MGQKETDTRIRRSFFWHGMGTDIKLHYVRTCAIWYKNKPLVRSKAAMQNDHAEIPVERVHYDICIGHFVQLLCDVLEMAKCRKTSSSNGQVNETTVTFSIIFTVTWEPNKTLG